MNARIGLQMILAAVMFAALVPMVSGGVAPGGTLNARRNLMVSRLERMTGL
jgi:hypothetical protein